MSDHKNEPLIAQVAHDVVIEHVVLSTAQLDTLSVLDVCGDMVYTRLSVIYDGGIPSQISRNVHVRCNDEHFLVTEHGNILLTDRTDQGHEFALREDVTGAEGEELHEGPHGALYTREPTEIPAPAHGWRESLLHAMNLKIHEARRLLQGSCDPEGAFSVLYLSPRQESALARVAERVDPLGGLSPIEHAKQTCAECGHARVAHNQVGGACNQCACTGFELEDDTRPHTAATVAQPGQRAEFICGNGERGATLIDGKGHVWVRLDQIITLVKVKNPRAYEYVRQLIANFIGREHQPAAIDRLRELAEKYIDGEEIVAP